MPICKAGTRLIYFAHIPKTGGSSVDAYLRTKGTVSFLTPERPDGLAATPQHLHEAVISQLFAPDFFDARFAVLRDPVARLMSEFLWRSEPLKPFQRLARPFRGGKARRIKVAGEKLSLTFDEWVPRVLAARDADPWIADNHLRPQVEFIREGDQLFALENGLDPVFRWIDEVTETAPSGGGFWEKKSSGQALTPSRKTRKLIEKTYAEDVRLHARLRA
ncbi:sulfotransferase family 2 domain-containing protein [Aestuariicoccus sp. MJ-SS9]|uniref:sulfotransferase family 2 domain-containing protein n=1 Tax=Aestuariicoccus sp. MJ-SS9 TaxID=3079855 RepID=UPI002912E518|nr:sulfotransferase family 2 domain-containing protein [Aestuariicoccus sp. MJ-SS9]MDU8911550.1 sulfotransferase family 2 domain-containing protein [Aestuariicoccus sp. MJ-SS9]